MKKLFYLISFLFISNLYADTFTPGPVGLTQPTTGAIDIKKSWAQKLNENFQAISTNTNATILTANNSNYTTITPAGIMQGGLGSKVVYSTSIADNTIQGVNLGYQIVLSSHVGANTIQGANISSATTLSVASMTVYATFIDTTGAILGGSTITILNVSNLATVSSMTVYGTITSSTGFVGGSSTFTTGSFTGNVNISSLIVNNIITSTSGFIGGSSTFTALNVTGIGGATFSSMTAFGTITSSAGFRGGSSTFSAVVVQTTITLPNSGASAGSYNNTNLTVNAAGLIVAAANGSAGGGTAFTTHTITLPGSGDAYISTTNFNTQNIGWVNDPFSTWTVIQAWAFCTAPSTIATTFSVKYSTGGTEPNGIFKELHSSSFTILPKSDVNSLGSYSAPVVPNNVTTFNPRDCLSLWTTFTASSGTATSGVWGVKIQAWKQP